MYNKVVQVTHLKAATTAVVPVMMLRRGSRHGSDKHWHIYGASSRRASPRRLRWAPCTGDDTPLPLWAGGRSPAAARLQLHVFAWTLDPPCPSCAGRRLGAVVLSQPLLTRTQMSARRAVIETKISFVVFVGV